MPSEPAHPGRPPAAASSSAAPPLGPGAGASGDSESTHHLERQRRANRDAAAALGLDPYGRRVDGLITLAEACDRYDPEADGTHQAAGKTPAPGYIDRRPRVHVAGRIVLLRDGGKLLWLTLRDHTGDLQVAVSQRDVDARSFSLAKSSDLGDIVIAEGPLMKTRTGETTVWAARLEPAAKCLVPPPEKHAGLADVELRYRQRYVDMWASPETTRTLSLRSRIVQRLRRFLDGEGYLEVETPMLQVLAGGAAARPFRTHMNALGIDLFMRVAPELYLKRLLVGGLPRIYEINRNFRNEGLDKRHNPEFTMLEAYQAFGDHRTMMSLTEAMVRDAARLVVEMGHQRPPGMDVEIPSRGDAPSGDEGAARDLVLPFGDWPIDYERPFERIAYADLFERALGFPMTDADRVLHAARERKLKHEGLDPVLVANNVFEEVAEPTLDPSRPTFITDYPSAISPLTRPKPSQPALADRADLFIGHMEIAPMYTELNDPDVQAAKFAEQLQGLDDEESTFRTFDADFIKALKVGMPPAGGMGLGVDRLVMLLTNQRSIRDVILFPLMRPEGQAAE